MKRGSFFWAFALVAVGVVWILANMNIIPAANLWALLYYLPILLIALGAGLILRSRWPAAGLVISGLVVTGAVLAVVFAPWLGWNNRPQWVVGMGGDVGGRVSGSGKIVSEAREVKDFTRLVVNYPADIVVQQGETTSLTIEADDNLIPQLSTQVSGGVMTIKEGEPDWNKRVNPTQLPRITMTVKDLSEVNFSPAGSLRIDGLKTNKLEVSVSGAGDVTLTKLAVTTLGCHLSGAGNIRADGTADAVNLDISGAGSFHGEDLSTQNADVHMSGASSATLWVERTLTVEISGVGSVNYYGNPNVSQEISGVGSVHKLGSK